MAEAKKPAPAAEPNAAAPKAKKNVILYVVIALLVLVIGAKRGAPALSFQCDEPLTCGTHFRFPHPWGLAGLRNCVIVAA